jgi:hypothetical protein
VGSAASTRRSRIIFSPISFGYTRLISFPLFFTELLAPGRPIWALASDTSMTVGWGSNQSSAVRFKAKEQMLRVCCESLRAMLRAGCVQHPNIIAPSPSPPMLRPCCDYTTIMLRPVLRATSNIRSSPPPPSRHRSQHHMSVTSKLNIRNIKI